MRHIRLALVIAASLFVYSEASFAAPPYLIPLDKQDTPTETTPALTKGYPPFMPSRATRSGYCCVKMDVLETGKPKKMQTTFCSEPTFKRASISAVRKWRFNPAVKDGQPVVSSYVGLVRFTVLDPKGKFILDADRNLVVNGKLDFTRERLCRNKSAS